MLCPPPPPPPPARPTLVLSLSVTSRIGTSRVSVSPKGCGKNRGKPSVVCVFNSVFSTKLAEDPRLSMSSLRASQCGSNTDVLVCVQYKRLSVCPVQTSQCGFNADVSVCLQYKRSSVCSVQMSHCVFSTNVSVYAQYTVRACVFSMNISMCAQYKRLSVCLIQTSECVSSTNISVCVQYKRLTVCSVRASQCILSTKYERFSVGSVQMPRCGFSMCLAQTSRRVFSTNLSVCVQYRRLSVCSVQMSQCVYSTNASVCVQYEWLNVFSVQTYLLMFYSPLSSKLRLLFKKSRSLRLVSGTPGKSLTSGKRSDDSPTFFFVVGCCKLLQLGKQLALCISL